MAGPFRYNPFYPRNRPLNTFFHISLHCLDSRESLSKLEPGVNPTCRFCEERNETFIHLTECPRLRDYQVDCFLGENRAWEWSLENIMKFSYCRAVDDAIAELEMGDYSFLSNSSATDSEDLSLIHI